MPFQTSNPLHFLSSIQNNRFIYPLVMASMLSLALLPYYTGGTWISGGEGGAFLDFTEHLHNFQYQWLSHHQFGVESMVPGANGASTIALALFENLTGSIALTNFLLIFLIYFLPFLGMYLLSLEVGAKPFPSFLCASFYILNPFSISWLSGISQWNQTAAAVLPFNFWIIHKYYDDNLKLFLFFGIISTLFACAYTNPPLHAIVHIATLISVYIVSYHKNGRFLLKKFLKKYILIFVSFLLFNSWWLINLVSAITFFMQMQIYTEASAQAWLAHTVMQAESPLAKGLILTHASDPSGSTFLGFFHNLWINLIVCLIPIILVIWLIFFNRQNHLIRLNIQILCLTLGSLFFLKGTYPPFGFIYQLMFKYVPFFNMFKSPIAKFGLLFVFLFSILILFVLQGSKDQKNLKKTQSFFGVYLLFCLIPMISGNLIPENKLNVYADGNEIYASKKYIDKPEYALARKHINKQYLYYRTLSLPGMGNYQILMNIQQDKFYTGMDPIRYNVGKPFIAPEDGPHASAIYNNFMGENLMPLLGMFNVHKLVVNGNSIPWFGTIGPREPNTIRERLKDLPANNFGNISIHTNLENFIPIIYSPSKIFIAEPFAQINQKKQSTN